MYLIQTFVYKNISQMCTFGLKNYLQSEESEAGGAPSAVQLEYISKTISRIFVI